MATNGLILFQTSIDGTRDDHITKPNITLLQQRVMLVLRDGSAGATGAAGETVKHAFE